MLDTFRRGQRWLTLIFISVIGLVFIFFMGQGTSIRPGAPSGNAIISLDEDRVEIVDFQRVRAQHEAQLAQSFGEQFDSRKMASYIDAQTLQSLLAGTILANAAHEMGFRITKRELQNLVRSSSGFRDDEGRFDAAAFKNFAEWEYGSQRNFMRVMRQDLLRQKMIRLLYAQAKVSDAEAQGAALQRMEQVRVAYVALDTETPPTDFEITDEELAAYLAEKRESLVAEYEERGAEFQRESRVRAQHILIELARDADDESTAAALARAEAARLRVSGGEPFEEVARSLSEDPGTAEKGGDLGLIARGETMPELEDAAFAAVVGEVGDIVRSDAGFHVVRVTERAEGGTRPFEEVGLELARESLQSSRARQRADEKAEALANAVRGGESLETASLNVQLPFETSVLFGRRADGFIPGIGASQEAMATAFTLDLDQASSPRIFTVGANRVLIQLVERTEPSLEELALAVEDERNRLLDSKRSMIIDEWVTQRRDDLVASGRLLVNAELVISGS